MGFRDEGRAFGEDILADTRDLLATWVPIVLRFVVLLALLRHLAGLEYRDALTTAALASLADVAAGRPKHRLRQRVRTIVRPNGEVSQDSDTDQS